MITFWNNRHDPKPQSAVSHPVGLLGCVGLFSWMWMARQYGLTGPYVALFSVVASSLPMILWSLLVDKVHRNPSTGIDWGLKRPWKQAMDTASIKLIGLWAIWGGITFTYAVSRWLWRGDYLFGMEVLGYIIPYLMAGSIIYYVWLDRYLIEPRDDNWHFGWFLVGKYAEADKEAMKRFALAWAVKGFFIAFMLAIIPGGFLYIVHYDFSGILQDPVALAQTSIAILFVIDVHIAMVGYILTLKPLDAHIRSANPFFGGWIAALICYPPFVLMTEGRPLFYRENGADWVYWLSNWPSVYWLWGAGLVALTAIYAWATIAFGLRFSNLTDRGIITHGPYALTKHPAYFSKNLYWWFVFMPFLATSGSWVDVVRNTTLLALTSAIYYWRAKTEEAHLLANMEYKLYAEWMDRNGLIPVMINWIKRRIGWWSGEQGKAPPVQSAE